MKITESKDKYKLMTLNFMAILIKHSFVLSANLI